MKKYTTEKRKISSTGRDIKILIFRPTAAKKDPMQTPGVLWIHGGGYAAGMAEMAYFSRPLALVKKYGAVVVCVSYRLSVEAPYPAALEDCHAALCWMKEHTAELGVSDSRLMVGGESAGGGLTAALCMYARDKGSVNIAYQMPLYPIKKESVHLCNVQKRTLYHGLADTPGVPPWISSQGRLFALAQTG